MSETPKAPADPPSADLVFGKLLVVDDDPSVTRMVRRVLGPRHEIHDYNGPREAIGAIAHGDRYDLILCDVTMPGCSGEQFLTAVREISAELAGRIIFLTGATSSAPGAAFLHDIPSDRRLMKPFRIEELRNAVSSLLRVSGRWR